VRTPVTNPDVMMMMINDDDSPSPSDIDPSECKYLQGVLETNSLQKGKVFLIG
jgi:hypothetical protein